MNNDRPNGKGAGQGSLLDLAERTLERVIRELDAICRELEARADGAPAQAKGAAVDLRKTILIVFEERQRIGKLVSTAAGGGSEGALDLDAARDEIGRRLALLRERNEAGSVPGEPE